MSNNNQGNKSATPAPEVKTETPATAPVAQPEVQAGPETPANVLSRTLGVRFSLAKASSNAKAPIARCLVNMSERPDGLFSGMVIDVPIFRAKDGNGVSVMIPGGSFPAIKPRNITVKNGAGVEFETTSPEIHGAAVNDQLPQLILTAYHQWLTTNNPAQTITFA